jgi:hypothetical protein
MKRKRRKRRTSGPFLSLVKRSRRLDHVLHILHLGGLRLDCISPRYRLFCQLFDLGKRGKLAACPKGRDGAHRVDLAVKHPDEGVSRGKKEFDMMGDKNLRKPKGADKVRPVGEARLKET